MKRFITAAIFAAIAMPVVASFSQAGTIERACNRSDRSAATRAMCGCIQDAADITLSGTDQRLAATFFQDPHRAQEVRQSDRSAHERFWLRYRSFGQTAEAMCS
ncbi:hypothetical protein [Cochlodiniinecator piscidefendens]|uniref:hypothetical protein n=1 Tax=Cochlodiniinecator piscidefendens TaxID=2715756 RepID=UPI00140C6563|nr:hypothetical protein [Cochlodiniinecator piscidefendens]